MLGKMNSWEAPRFEPLRKREADYVLLAGVVLVALMLLTLLWFVPITGTRLLA